MGKVVVAVCVAAGRQCLGRCQRWKGEELVGAAEADLKTEVAAVIKEVAGTLATMLLPTIHDTLLELDYSEG